MDMYGDWSLTTAYIIRSVIGGTGTFVKHWMIYQFLTSCIICPIFEGCPLFVCLLSLFCLVPWYWLWLVTVIILK